MQACMSSRMAAEWPRDVIAAAVQAGQARVLLAAELSATRVLEELRRIAFIDARSFYDEHGNIEPVSEWTAEQGAALTSAIEFTHRGDTRRWM